MPGEAKFAYFYDRNAVCQAARDTPLALVGAARFSKKLAAAHGRPQAPRSVNQHQAEVLLRITLALGHPWTE
jgi:hypothetical protein